MKYQTKTQVSSGGVILREAQGQTQVCLIRLSRNGQTIWGLPKGHVEAGEEPQETAVREVREETGLLGEPLFPLGEIRYQFIVKEERARFLKTVHFFALRYVEGKTDDHDDEVDAAAWVELTDAVSRVTYDNERTVLVGAQRLLSEQPHLIQSLKTESPAPEAH